MGKKGNKNKINTHQTEQPASLVHPGENKVSPGNRPESEIPSADVLSHVENRNNSCSNKKDKVENAMTNDQSLLEKLCECAEEDDDDQLEESRENGIDYKVERKRKKKERQKERKLARKMAAKRRYSELSLGEFLEDDQGLSSTSPVLKSPSISLYRHPFTTLEYFFREIPCLLCDVRKRWEESRRRKNFCGLLEILLIVFIAAAVLTVTYFWITKNDPLSVEIKQYISWYSYWIFLGILSSVGLGTGLHTFVLYLGPFIAKVSLAAEECSSLDFPQPPYPNQITCPEVGKEGHHETSSIWAISAKIRWETLAWGFGTALGELPPYFIARAASLTGDGSSTDSLEDHEGFLARIQQKMRDFVMKVGFWGILLCASIPNPLFDLAGITCGHFQVPFFIFFGATAIGKTIVKSQLQMIIVILAFNEKSLERTLESVANIPSVGPSLSKVITDFIKYQRAALHDNNTSQSGGILKLLTEIIVLAMILYFVGSIINGMARSYQKRVTPKNKKKEKISKTKKRLKPET